MSLVIGSLRSRRSASLLHQLLKRLPDNLGPKLFGFSQIWELCKAIQLANGLSDPGDDV